jgi:large subunit ribosomal protein L30
MAPKKVKEKKEMTGPTIKIQYYRSSIGYSAKQKEIVRSLGLTKLNQIVERPDTPATRGVVHKVPHLIRIIE